MTILVTGAAGFLGGRLIRALLAGEDTVPACSRIVAADRVPCSIDDPRVDVHVGSLDDPSFVKRIVASDTGIVYHLGAVVSGQSEADFDLAMRVNVDATRAVLETCRTLGTAPRVVFTSSLAVFGGSLPAVVRDDTAPLPQSTYGASKLVGEILVAEYTRRGFVDGIAGRLPTVSVRPGPPNAALSSFVSGIIREPLGGVDTICPVPVATRLWISSPDVTIRNLLHAGRIPAAALEGSRIVNLPGLSVTVSEMLDSLERLGGPSARARVRCAPDELVIRIVGSWPADMDASRATRAGFEADAHVDDVVRQYLHSVQSADA
jgi:nucleoside-diphosphate-sugar epimerase